MADPKLSFQSLSTVPSSLCLSQTAQLRILEPAMHFPPPASAHAMLSPWNAPFLSGFLKSRLFIKVHLYAVPFVILSFLISNDYFSLNPQDPCLVLLLLKY